MTDLELGEELDARGEKLDALTGVVTKQGEKLDALTEDVGTLRAELETHGKYVRNEFSQLRQDLHGALVDVLQQRGIVPKPPPPPLTVTKA